ncbi:LysR family transcriptional regulator [Lampropedia puyangensis]|uniref:LysR family transcriptional regulator n=1 Tax=Lampropedia puyangensis TaxID=1330072 RepID=A0A4S8FDX6_9BURK|nr:LysR family transcriptional regulator [Lampropedia puyangensis]THU04092.1 LysR family transcriptional regulator [Lampropedia puyangensis]
MASDSSQPSLRASAILPDLHLLMVLGETHSYTQAAQRLGLSKATVSQRIAALERTMGIPLVQRSTRAVALTAAGQQLVDETRPAFSQIEHSLAAVRDLAASPRGLVRLTAPVALGRQHLMPALSSFALAYPDIRIELDLNDRLTNLVQEGFDLAIRHTQAAPDNTVAWPLCTSQAILVASPQYLQRYGSPKHPHDLEKHDCLVYLRGRTEVQSWTLTRHSKRQRIDEHCHIPIKKAVFKANNSEVLREAALAGLGIALLPDFSAQAHHQEGRHLHRVLPQWQSQGFFGNQIFAIRPWAPQVPLAVKHLVAHLQHAFKPGFATL